MPAKPLQFEARSGDAALLAVPLPSVLGAARIHSVFERVVNIETGHGRLLTLAFADADNAPESFVVNIRRWSGLGLAPGQEVRFAHGVLSLGGLLFVSLARAIPWQCRLPAYPANDSRLRSNLTQAQEIIVRQGSGIGIGDKDAARDLDTDVDRVLRRLFAQARDGLCEALAAGDLVQAQPYAAQLVGLGPGLTPAGDDFLLGLLVALNIPDSPGHDLRSIGNFILECAKQQTHAISFAGLRQAAAGQARESIVDLCEALLDGEPENVRPTLERVLRFGSSSGTDIALGLLCGFKLHLRWLPFGL
ncbi:DUF2877 domain-containing protein [Herbaspirillum sp. HC18]|nr:DUF2877 domain-containing protein [Herbaspirillum sp. HC18]